MKKFAFSLLSILVLAIGGNFFLPGKIILDSKSSVQSMIAGVKKYSVLVDGKPVHYLKGGQGPVILFLHGFGGSKENWLDLMMNFSKHTLVALDLPGFGESPYSSETESIDDYTLFLQKFINSLDIRSDEKVKIVGHSTGGLIAGRLASIISDRVSALWLICPLGTLDHYQTPMKRLLKKGDNLLIPMNSSEAKKLLGHLFHRPPFVPYSVLRFLGENNRKNEKSLLRLLESTHGLKEGSIHVRPSLDEYLSNYSGDKFLTWGKNDLILSVKDAHSLNKKINFKQIELLDDVGHMPMMEKPSSIPEGFFQIGLNR